jgi:hypothetical protein
LQIVHIKKDSTAESSDSRVNLYRAPGEFEFGISEFMSWTLISRSRSVFDELLCTGQLF